MMMDTEQEEITRNTKSHAATRLPKPWCVKIEIKAEARESKVLAESNNTGTSMSREVMNRKR
jgi:hypothetical protein